MRKIKAMAMTLAVMAALFNGGNVVAAENKNIQEEKQEIEERIDELTEKISEQQEVQGKIIKWLEKMNAQNLRGSALVNPAVNSRFGYVQDAGNSQGNSTVVFKYAPNQLYKIYCRVGYLTDLTLKKGETVTFVGGGDTSAWAVEKTTVAGVPHIYIKPMVEESTTNLIITTNKRSYQLIVNTSDWYNPMVMWNYGQEEIENLNLTEEKNQVSGINGSIEMLNFKYKISGKSKNNPVAVFDDGEKTIIKFEKMPKRLPSIFVKMKGKKGLTLVNSRVRENCYILDRVADEIEMRMSAREIIKISRKGSK